MSTHTHKLTANRTGPNNAGQVEDGFVNEIRRRFRTLRGLIRRTVGYENDALNLSSNADEREAFDFPSRTGKREAFMVWLRDAIQDEILEPINPINVEDGQHWTAQYIREAFVRGVNQSTGLLFQQGVSIENIPDENITQRPIFARTLRNLYQRTYSNLKSVTDDMAPQVRETLTEGFAEGHNPKRMARELTKEVRNIQKPRAETLARSETINAHSSAALDNYERAGVNTVSHVRWSAADDPRTCPFCRRLDGTNLTLDEMRTGSVQWRGQIWRLQPPAHPNGRCVPKPTIGADRLTSTLQERLDENFTGLTVLSGG
jgi:SPP1 gp7 family putative phage head morphogenesis protein